MTTNQTPKDQIVRAAWRSSLPGLFVVFFFSLAINILKFAIPIYLLQVLDRIPASRSIETLVMLTLAAFVAIAAGIALEVVRRRMLLNWAKWIELTFTPPVVTTALSRREDDDWELTTALGDIDYMQKFAGRSQRWFDLVIAPLFFLGLFLLHPVLGWIGITYLGITLALAVTREYVSREPRRFARNSAAKKAELLATIQANHDTVAAHNMASIVAERWKRVAQGSAEAQSRWESRTVPLDTLIIGLGRLFRIGMIAAGAWLFLRDDLTIGGMFAARVILGFGCGLIERGAKEWSILRDARLGYRRTKARLAKLEKPAASVAGDVHEQAIVLDLITFRHNGQRRDLFKRLSMKLEPGELLAVTGPAASGKTTLSRLLVGLLEPRHGQIRMGDVEITRLPDEIKTRLIGYMPQNTQILRATIRENIARFDEGPLDKVIAAARLVDIHDTIVRLPEGYDTVIGSDYEGLSGSELKRIAIARAMYGSPRLVVLDEPAANLDRDSRGAMEAAVNELRRNGSSIVITQAISSPRINGHADKFLDLGEGRDEVPAAHGEQAVRRPKISAV